MRVSAIGHLAVDLKEQMVSSASRLNESRFRALFARCGADSASRVGHSFAELTRRYAESSRHYHCAQHINHCLREFDNVRHLADHPDAIELAIWFHDAIYVAGDPMNEENSAALFLDLSDGCLGHDLQHAVSDLILITMHRERPRNRDEAFVVDIDLSSFGVSWPEFLRQSWAVRDEMTHLTDRQFAAAQLRFLTSLLQRERFFYSDYFERRYGDAARSNAAGFAARMRAHLALPSAA